MQAKRSVGLCGVSWFLILVGCAVEAPDARQAAQQRALSSEVGVDEPAVSWAQPTSDVLQCFCPLEPIIAGPNAQAQLAAQVPQICQDLCGVCGDGFCSQNEPFNCPSDCGPQSFCGDLVCDPGELLACPSDCGPPPVCGNFLCESNEAFTCASDCVPPPTPCGTGACKNAFSVTSAQAQARMAWAQRCAVSPAPGITGTPRPGTQYLTAQSASTYAAANPVLQRHSFPVYFDFVTGGAWSAPDASGTSCAAQPTSAINSTLCVAGCVPTTLCGNGACEPGETSSSCAIDCGPPPPVCGDGFCQFPENASTCSLDCGPVCGDGLCDFGEVCQIDCGQPCPRPPCQIEVLP